MKDSNICKRWMHEMDAMRACEMVLLEDSERPRKKGRDLVRDFSYPRWDINLLPMTDEQISINRNNCYKGNYDPMRGMHGYKFKIAKAEFLSMGETKQLLPSNNPRPFRGQLIEG